MALNYAQMYGDTAPYRRARRHRIFSHRGRKGSAVSRSRAIPDRLAHDHRPKPILNGINGSRANAALVAQPVMINVSTRCAISRDPRSVPKKQERISDEQRIGFREIETPIDLPTIGLGGQSAKAPFVWKPRCRVSHLAVIVADRREKHGHVRACAASRIGTLRGDLIVEIGAKHRGLVRKRLAISMTISAGGRRSQCADQNRVARKLTLVQGLLCPS